MLYPDAKVGVEVGTFCGENALALLRSMPGLFLYLVDPYEPYDHPGMDKESLRWARGVMEQNLKPFRRWAHVPLKSVEAAEGIENASLDFVFIDDDHSSEAVEASVRAWLPKVKHRSGLIGHDFSWPSVKVGLAKAGINPLQHDDDCWVAG